jgi:hypothetical protein
LSQWEYALTPEEEAIAVEVGYQRQKPYLGQPAKNRNYSEGDAWELWQHAVAAGSELAAARMFGLNEFVPHFNKWKSALDIPQLGEVRYTFSDNPKLRYTSNDNNDLIYILMTDGMRHKTRRTQDNGWLGEPFRAVGWLYGHQCINPLWQYNATTMYVPINELNSMESLNVNATRSLQGSSN